MIPRIIHFSVPEVLTPGQSEIIALARDKHPGWEVKVWQDPIDRSGFKLSQFLDMANSGAQRADLIRLDAVFRYGGVYVDSDIRLLKSLEPLVTNYDFFVCSENGRLATNAMFGATQGHPAIARLIDDLIESPPDWSVPPNVTTGPVFFSNILQWRSDVSIVPRETFYPYNWNEQARAPHPQTYGVHEWAASWKEEVKPNRVEDFKRTFQRRFAPANVLRRGLRRFQKLSQTNETVINARPSIKAYSASEKLVRKTIHGHTILLSGDDVSITPELMAKGYYELREELFMKRILSGGDFFIDIGANVGVFSLLAAAMVGRFGRVFAYEPNPSVADLLRKSAAMNWMHDRIIVRPAAVGAKNSTEKLVFSASRLGDAALDHTGKTGSTSEVTRDFIGDSREVEVKVVTLDGEFPADIPIRALKIDAEGFEAEVLAGADRLISHGCIDFIMLEAIPEVSGSSWRSLLEATSRVVGFGYEPWKFDYNGAISPTALNEIRYAQGSRNILLRRKGSRLWRNAALHRSRRHNRARAALQRSVST
jgi:FkbM family methyltransferase